MSNPKLIMNWCRVCMDKTHHEQTGIADNVYVCVRCRVLKINPWMDMVECMDIITKRTKDVTQG